ncbi:hypothetical protein EXU57_09650 [Segetibacter sp. 3557_3]|uniref:toxin-antitoxin system YwqK family antitoxin n=1 Tax=Segetibacter sp. 3557_3 TaxID=2547429 RepID=UPI001058610A|nr:hypothetical protein [Segetibacter sp. 3557_3]TDH27052.1 hypothetical protein EXU57_09650 [Segetibacter sp. 3557_3]
MRFFLVLFLAIGVQSFGQYKSFTIGAKRDTLNAIDQQDRRQGKWVVKVPGLRGEPGYDEEGVYRDGKKEGTWRVYTQQGDLFAVENYRWGNKNGKSQYFNIRGIVREESWKAVNPANPYDTIEVPDLADPGKVEMKVIKIEGTAVKHGTWRYYDPATGMLAKSETYFLDKIEDPNARLAAQGENIADSSADKTATAPKKVKPKEVVEFEKKLGKKGKKVIDGRTY